MANKDCTDHVTAETVSRWHAEGMDWAEIDRRIVADRITPSDLVEWFAEVPGAGPWPNGEQLGKLARDIAHLREAGWPYAMTERKMEIYQRVTHACAELRAALEEWSDFGGNGAIDQSVDHRFEKLEAYLSQNGFFGSIKLSTSKPRGQPKAEWHRWGREFVKLLKPALETAGYKGRMRETDEESAVAIVGAAFVHRCFAKNITPAGFATAMKSRNRSKEA